jgi:mono/diheme cytochrome c family protein
MRRLLPILLLSAAISGQPLPQRAPDDYQQQVLPVLTKSCMACHNDRAQTGGLSFEPFRDAATAAQKPELWQKVLDKINAKQMPPSPAAPLSAPEMAAVSGWIRKLPAIAAASANIAALSPGRVTARRLNRIEYNNTIRDLLGVALRPADEFPVDDSGYGFDNIGDVLSISPLLMEKYLSAAQTVSRAAVYGETYPEKPTLLVKLMSKKVQDDAPARGNVTPFALRGALYASFHAPVEAEYEFRIRYQNFRGTESVVQDDGPARGAQRGAAQRGQAGATDGRGARPSRDEQNRLAAPPIDLKFTVDDKLVYTATVQGNADYNYARGEDIVRVKMSPGDHALRFSFPDYANVPDPRKQLNPDGRRKLYVDYVDIVGPFGVTASRPPGFSKIFICGNPGRYTPACENQIVANLMTRAYRRPPTSAEIGKMMALVAQVKKRDSFEDAIRVVTEAVLISPNFLFRIERDLPTRTSATAYEISDYELASRLSYFLWSSMPDDELFRLAEQKRLHTPAVLNAQVQRMLADSRSSALAENFGEQWLNLRLMDRTKPDAARFSSVDDELLEAMRRETGMFISSVFRENRSVLDFIDGRYSYMNGPLARYYGISGIDGEAFQRVELDGEQRSGILTHASILSISSYATRTSPVLRGKWVLDTLLGAAPPPPPDDIPPLVEKDLGTAASIRQRLEQHRADPSCAACHNAMDPIGFGLENYDAAGAWRTKDGNFDIDNSGTLPNGRSFVGAKALKEVLKADAGLFARNFTEKLLTYALGRGLELSDRPVVDQISRDLANDNYRFVTLVNQIVNSRPFKMRAKAS